MFALENTWQVIGLIGAGVGLRLVVPRAAVLPRQVRVSVVEFVDSALIALLLVFCIVRPFVIQAFYIPSGSMLPTLYPNDRILVNKFVFRFRDPKPGEIIVFRAPPGADNDPTDHSEKDFIKRCMGAPGDLLRVEAPYTYRNGELLHEATERDRAAAAILEAAEETAAQALAAEGGSSGSVPLNPVVRRLVRMLGKEPDTEPNGIPDNVDRSLRQLEAERLIDVTGDEIGVPSREDLRGALPEWYERALPYTIAEAPDSPAYRGGVWEPDRLPPDRYYGLGDNRNDSNDSHKWGSIERDRILGKAMVIFWPPQRIRVLH